MQIIRRNASLLAASLLIQGIFFLASSANAESPKVDYQFMSGNTLETPIRDGIVGFINFYDENSVKLERVPGTSLEGIRINVKVLAFTKEKAYGEIEGNNTDYLITCKTSSPWKSDGKAFYIQLGKTGVLPSYIPEGLADEKCVQKWLGMINR